MQSEPGGPARTLGVMTRLALALAGLLALACWLAQAMLVGGAPNASTAQTELDQWLHHSAEAVRWATLAGTLGIVAFGVMTAILARTLPEPFRLLYALGISGILITSSIQGWFWAALARAQGELSPDFLKLAALIATQWGPTLTAFTIMAIAPIAWLGLKQEAGVARWLGILASVSVLEQLFEMITIFGTEGFIAPGGGMNMELGAGLVAASLFGFTFCRLRAR